MRAREIRAAKRRAKRERDLEKRRADLIEAVRRHPGIHVLELYRSTPYKRGTTRLTMDRLEEEGVVLSERPDFHQLYRHFFLRADRWSPTDRRLVMQLRRPGFRQLLDAIRADPGIRGAALKERVDMEGVQVSYTCVKLTEDGILSTRKEGMNRFYRIRSPARYDGVVARLDRAAKGR